MNPISALGGTLVPSAVVRNSVKMGEGVADAGSPGGISELGGFSVGPSTGAGGVPASSFSDLLGGMVREVSEKQAQAGSTVGAMLAGQDVPLHQAMIAMEEASVSFQLMVEVRNKLLESYQELMRMQI